jgi:secondary thiamine-phosphate synthase enzyme
LTLHTGQLRFHTEGDGDVIDLTEGVQSVVAQAAVETGVAAVFVPGSTAAVTLMEYEPGGVRDMQDLMDRLVPPSADYNHNRMAGDTNAHSHLQAAIVGPSETAAVKDGHLVTGTWQQFVLVDFDDHPRDRTIMVQVLS